MNGLFLSVIVALGLIPIAFVAGVVVRAIRDRSDWTRLQRVNTWVSRRWPDTADRSVGESLARAVYAFAVWAKRAWVAWAEAYADSEARADAQAGREDERDGRARPPMELSRRSEDADRDDPVPFISFFDEPDRERDRPRSRRRRRKR